MSWYPASFSNFRNLIRNPVFDLDQALEGATVNTTVGTSSFVQDGWATVTAGTALVVKTGQALTASVATGGPWYPHCTQITVTTAETTLTSSYLIHQQNLEGQDFAPSAYGTTIARPVALSFWAACSVASCVCSVSLYGIGANRSYVSQFTLPSTANTWKQYFIPILGDTGGTWSGLANAATAQLGVRFCTYANSTFQGSAGAWTAGNLLGTSANSSSFVTTINSTISFTGVKLEFAGYPTRLFVPTQLDNLQICQRYYEKSFSVGTALGTATTAGSSYIQYPQPGSNQAVGLTVPYKVKKCASPTVTLYSTGTGTSGKVRDITNSADVTPTVTSGSGQSSFTWTATPSALGAIQLAASWVADSRI